MRALWTAFFLTWTLSLVYSCGEENSGQNRAKYGGNTSDGQPSGSLVVQKVMTCDDAKLINSVNNVLGANCIRCHGVKPADNAKFGKILDLKNLISTGKVRPGNPSVSLLLTVLEKGVMPPSGALDASQIK